MSFLHIWVFFTATLADGFLFEFERQFVSSSLQDSSNYSGRSQKRGSWDSLHSFSSFQVLLFLRQSFIDCMECTNYNWYNYHSVVFHLSSQVLAHISLFAFLQFYPLDSRKSKFHFSLVLYCFCRWLLLGLIVWLRGMINSYVSTFYLSQSDSNKRTNYNFV